MFLSCIQFLNNQSTENSCCKTYPLPHVYDMYNYLRLDFVNFNLISKCGYNTGRLFASSKLTICVIRMMMRHWFVTCAHVLSRLVFWIIWKVSLSLSITRLLSAAHNRVPNFWENLSVSSQHSYSDGSSAAVSPGCHRRVKLFQSTLASGSA